MINVMHVLLKNCNCTMVFYTITGKNKNYKLNRKFQNHPVFSFSRQSTFPNKNDKMPHNSTFSLHLQLSADHAENCLVLLACIYELLLKLMKLLRTQSLKFMTAHSLNSSFYAHI